MTDAAFLAGAGGVTRAEIIEKENMDALFIKAMRQLRACPMGPDVFLPNWLAYNNTLVSRESGCRGVIGAVELFV
jgi:hypothetical protein